MKEWWDGLAQRERQMVTGGAVTLLLAAVYFLGWEPILQRVDALQEDTREQRATLAWMQQTKLEIQQLRASTGAAARPAGGQSMLANIDQSARAAKLGGAVKRVQPDSESKVRVWLERASFDDLISWLETLERNYGVRVVTIALEARPEAGLVDARVEFAGAAG